MAAGAAVEAEGVTKSYAGRVVVAGVSFTVRAGEIYALLGPNGAGKTTTLEILMGHRRRDGGRVAVLGEDPTRGERRWRERIGVTLQERAVEPYLTVEETMRLYARFYRAPADVDEVLDMVQLAPLRRRRVGKLSGGQQRRLEVALALVGRPEVLFLDEPTTGFDPAARRQAWDMIKALAGSGTTVLLTTHYLDEAERLADRIGVMVDGALVTEGTSADITAASGTTQVSFSLPAPLRALDLPLEVEEDGGRCSLSTDHPTRDLAALTGWAVARGVELERLRVTRATLEDVYMELMRDE